MAGDVGAGGEYRLAPLTVLGDPLHLFSTSAARSRGVIAFKPPRFAYAHSGTESYLYVKADDGSISGNVQFPVGDLNSVLGLSLPTEKAALTAAMASSSDQIESYAAEHVSVGGWPLRFTGHRALERKVGSYAILDYELTEIPNPIPRQFSIRYDGIIHSNHHHHALILVKTSAGIGPLQTVNEERFSCSEDQHEHVVTLPDESFGNDLGGAFTHVVAGGKEFVRRARKRLKRIGK